MEIENKKLFKKILIQKKTWLITGVAGFIGSNILEILISNNQNVIGIDNFSSGKKKNISKFLKNKNFLFIKKDINDLKKKFFEDKKIDYVIHLAAMASVSDSIKYPKKCFENNVSGFQNVISSLANIKKIKKIIYASSAAVYGDSIKKNNEYSKLNPLSPYALSKICNEDFARIYSKKLNIEFIGFRFFNIFGKNQDHNSEYSSVISKWIYNLKNNKKINIYGNGQTTRDFCDINNVIFFIILSTQKKLKKNEIFNLASGKSISLNYLAKTLILQIKKNKNYLKFINYKNFKRGDIFKSKSDISKIKKKIYSKIPFKTTDGLKNII